MDGNSFFPFPLRQSPKLMKMSVKGKKILSFSEQTFFSEGDSLKMKTTDVVSYLNVGLLDTHYITVHKNDSIRPSRFPLIWCVICFQWISLRRMYLKEELGRYFSKTYPKREKMYFLVYAPSEDSNQHVHPRCLIRVFIVCMKKLCILCYPKRAK